MPRQAPAEVDRPVVPADVSDETIGAFESNLDLTRSGDDANRWGRLYQAGLLLVDGFGFALAGMVALAMWSKDVSDVYILGNTYMPLLLLAVPALWIVTVASVGGYSRRVIGVGAEEFKRVLKAGAIVIALICFVTFVFKLPMSRYIVGTTLPGGVFLTVAFRYMVRLTVHRLRRRGVASHRVVLAGDPLEVSEVLSALHSNSSAGLLPVAVCLTGSRQPISVIGTLPAASGMEALLPTVAEHCADTIAVCGTGGMSPAELRRLGWRIEGTGIDLVVAPALTNVAGPRVHIRPVEGVPLMHVEEPGFTGSRWLVKTAIDRIGAGLLLLLLSPVLLVTAALVKFTSSGPVFFRQSRVGRNGEMFKVWKFRTMYSDAEHRWDELFGGNEADGLLFKVSDDPRVTKVGKWLREFSIDELPQLFNVLAGEMSLVGPRPLAVDDDDFQGDVRRRLAVPPGITGLWQVSGRRNLSWEESVRLDLYYVDNWSLMVDLVILWRTVGTVVFRKGAY